jgi:NAD(P)-dependent dehydrogenase (short-subunit alcohol dehydrogenase family)
MALLSLEGKAALVTGGSRRIGAAVARALDAAGARVAIVGRHRRTLEDVARTLAHDPLVLEFDLSDPAAPSNLAAEAWEALGGVDVLVNNAAATTRVATEKLEADTVDRL